MRFHHRDVFTLAVASLLLACADTDRPMTPRVRPPSAEARDLQGANGWLVLFHDAQVAPDFAVRIASLGGRVDESLDEIGVATVSGLSDDAVAALRADASVEAIEARQPPTEEPSDLTEDVPPEFAQPDALPRDASGLPSPTLATLYPRQWNLRAVEADDAWAASYLGWDQARVAIMDTGIDYLNPELEGLVDLKSSASFADDDARTAALYPDRAAFTDLFWHGTANASLVSSAAKQLAGVNQNVTLVAVKTGNAAGNASTDALAAIYWAVKQRADVMSFGGGVQVDSAQQPALVAAYFRAFEYAWRKGAVSVAPAGDNGRNRDIIRAQHRLGIPCDAPHVICVSLTAPTADAPLTGPWVNVDAAQPSNNYGSVITVAAPGGSRFLNTRIWLTCTTSPGPSAPSACRPGAAYTGLVQGVGTSWSSATVAGLAAALVTKYGHNHPDLIRQRIIETADDRGAPGWDPYYGWGRINVARALDVPIRRARDDEQ